LLLRNILNKIKWTEGLEGVEIIILHRGAYENKKVIKGEEIKDIAPRAIICKDDTIIPYHRVLCIKKNGVIIWSKRK